jgi:hypothetical protein
MLGKLLDSSSPDEYEKGLSPNRPSHKHYSSQPLQKHHQTRHGSESTVEAYSDTESACTVEDVPFKNLKCLYCTMEYSPLYFPSCSEHFCSRDCNTCYLMFYKLPESGKEDEDKGSRNDEKES